MLEIPIAVNILSDPDHYQNLIICSFYHPERQIIALESVHNILSIVANRQTYRQTDKQTNKHTKHLKGTSGFQ